MESEHSADSRKRKALQAAYQRRADDIAAALLLRDVSRANSVEVVTLKSGLQLRIVHTPAGYQVAGIVERAG